MMVFDQHIGIIDVPEIVPTCNNLINFFEEQKKLGVVQNRQQENPDVKKTYKSDEFLYLRNQETEFEHQINSALWDIVYKEYTDKYFILHEFARHNSFVVKVQKTLPGEGYHIWHAEADSVEFAHRVLVWGLYLNDVDAGGETEFLYQHLRVTPKAGRFVIWPAAFTHTHRGNPPLRNEKYLATGWIQFEIPN